jgi:hypothetical protein
MFNLKNKRESANAAKKKNKVPIATENGSAAGAPCTQATERVILRSGPIS